jgi:predicted metal-dependent hydrolase
MKQARWNSILSTAPFDHLLSVAGRDVPVHIRRHPQARRFKLRFDPLGGSLRLTVPPRGNVRAALSWVSEQEQWVARQLERHGADAQDGWRVGDGTRLPLGDELVNIVWQSGAARQPRLIDGAIILGGPPSAVGRRTACWLADIARDRFTEASFALAGGAGLPLTGVSVGDPKSRWGSCSVAKRIRYSWRLIMAPRFVQDSVVAHEVAHLAHMNHGPRFHQLAESLLGTDPAPARAWLRRHGAELQRWDFG